MCIEITATLNGLNWNKKKRQKAVNSYYENPSYCKGCGELIKIGCSDKVSNIRRNVFCNHSCAAIYNNAGVKRFQGVGIVKANSTCLCGRKKSYKAQRCGECIREAILDKTLNIVKSKVYPHWNRVREHARKTMIRVGIEKHCRFCSHNEFDFVVEVCHIKDITSFDENTTVREVNNLNNLIYMCPSHHALFDKGLLQI